MKKLFNLLVVALLTVSFVSCSKEEPTPAPAKPIYIQLVDVDGNEISNQVLVR